jgi:HlyD family type I secretion membrane fusion protein
MSTALVPQQIWYADVPRRTTPFTAASVVAILLFIVGFGYWSASAMIAGAVITSGAFVAAGENKVVQHLEGGVIHNILVHEGDLVEPGQVLVQLDDTAAKAEMARLNLREMRSEAMEARLIAQAQGDVKVTYPSQLVAKRGDPDVASIINAQELTFEAWRRDVDTTTAGLNDGINALKERISAARVEKESTEKQIELIDEELGSKNELLPKGLIRKSEVLALQRAKATLEGDLGRHIGEIGDSTDQIAKTQEQIAGIRTNAAKEAVEQLHQVRADIADVRERIRAQENVLDRVAIMAPVGGVVVKLRYHTPGGVIEPGKAILEIVPAKVDLVIEVRVRPQDIDHVKVGQEAAVRLTALNRRTTPTLLGHVIYVSADVLPDDAQAIVGRDVYVVRIALDNKQPGTMHEFRPRPGLPAEVYIKTSERTFFQYLIQPIEDSMSRAFRES